MNDEPLVEAATALEEKLATFIDRHYTMEYPFHQEWKALHFALYGHPRQPIFGACRECIAEESSR